MQFFALCLISQQVIFSRIGRQHCDFRAALSRINWIRDAPNLITRFTYFIFLYKMKVKSRTLCEKCPNTEFFLVRVFPHSDWIFPNSRIQSECVKIQTRKNSVFWHISHSGNCKICTNFLPNYIKIQSRIQYRIMGFTLSFTSGIFDSHCWDVYGFCYKQNKPQYR